MNVPARIRYVAIPIARDAVFWLFAPWDALREGRAAALREAFRRVRRDVWTAREARLVAKWESYG